MSTTLQRILLILLAAGAMSVGAAPRDGLDVRLSVAQPVLRGNVDVTVGVTVTNTTRHPIQVLRWQLPSDDVEGALFRITREDGSAVRYTGPVVKRAAPDASDRVRIEAGASLSYEVELTATYDLARNGRYAIEYLSRGKHGSDAASLGSQLLYLWLEGRSAKSAGTAAPATTTGSLAFTGKCSATEMTAIETAVADATVYAQDARAYLARTQPGDTPRYTTWFGAFVGARWNLALDHFVAIEDAFKNKPITVDCGCNKKSVYAYVYPTRPYVITVCGAFWAAPRTGTDSKAGTLIHEMSHFNVVASTDDWAYGQTAAKNLALSDPDKAVDNADSHEYFAENTPAQK